jgi:hypothetical protein
MTIGYGAPTNDIFYGGCGSMATLLTLESFAGIFLDSICIGMFFARFARATVSSTVWKYILMVNRQLFIDFDGFFDRNVPIQSCLQTMGSFEKYVDIIILCFKFVKGVNINLLKHMYAYMLSEKMMMR